MTYSNYMLMYYIALAATIVLLLVTVLLFFVLRIPKAFNDLTRTYRKKGGLRVLTNSREARKITHDTAGAETDRMGMPATDKISESGRILDENPANTVVTEKIQTDTLAGSAETTGITGWKRRNYAVV